MQVVVCFCHGCVCACDYGEEQCRGREFCGLNVHVVEQCAKEADLYTGKMPKLAVEVEVYIHAIRMVGS